MTERNIPQRNQVYDTDDVSIGDLIRFFWRQRGLILAVVIICGLSGTGYAVWSVVQAPKMVNLSLDFRLHFPGAVEGRYPNGQRFSVSDIVAPSVVRPIYEQLELHEFITFEKFKTSLSVVETNVAVDLLRKEYQARLSGNMTQAERSALEAEYLAKRKAARNGEYRMLFTYHAGLLPENVIVTAMPAILEKWAEEVQLIYGAWTYNVAVPGQALLDDKFLEGEDYLVVADMLRTGLKRIDQSADRLSGIPGANLIRNPGENGLSLLEVRARLADTLRFKIEPLFAIIYHNGIFRDREATAVYLQHRLFRLRLEATAMESKSQAIDSVLAQLGQRQLSSVDTVRSSVSDSSTTTIIPQFGEGFFDKLMEIGVQSADVDFRRHLSKETIEYRHAMVDLRKEKELYGSLLAMLDRNHPIIDTTYPAKDREVGIVQIEDRFAEVLYTARYLIDQIQGLHQIISRHNLQPHRTYEVTEPLQRGVSGDTSLKRMALIQVGALLMGFFLAIFLAGIRVALRHMDAKGVQAVATY